MVKNIEVIQSPNHKLNMLFSLLYLNFNNFIVQNCGFEIDSTATYVT